MLLKLAIAMSTLFFAPEPEQGGPKTQVMYVKENKVPCTGVAPMECLQVRTENESEWSNLYTNIQGFNYQPGYQYKLLVTVSNIKNPPADGSSLKYTLKKVMYKKKVAVSNSGNPFVSGKRWTLVEMNGSPITSGKIWLEFDPSGSRYHGNGGCNGIGGEFKQNATAGIVSFTRGMSTMMACIDENDMRNETNFQRSLEQKTYNYRVENGRLNLYGNGRRLLSFKQGAGEEKPQQQPDVWAFISSKRWNLIQLHGTTINEPGIYLEFDPAKGRYHGRGGCNIVNGTFKHTATTVTMGPGMSTRMACGEAIMKRETEFMKAIGSKTYKFDVAEQTLNFYEKDKLVMIFGMTDKEQK
ncbi:Heat shock protein HslJ [Chitinophaga jiangningensis]|uniref:Heat shock protein HslJ n=1 Tax=Chitinophaga jiangningensis TaxID=1419482 RepID=A0A1M7I268_9BACT|nr:META domain-containing protein [Chitinophaga jiangningensis]SHM34795.1 Heat shock protein HslJ [Chitinophaga jiangningensis]